MHLDAFLPLDAIVSAALTVTGLAKRARADYLAPRLVERHWRLPRLPAAFAGFRLLQLSDLHLDLDTDFAPALIEKMRDLVYDAVVITGDFRNSTYENHARAVAEAGTIIATLREPRFGILGNHDFIEQVTELELLGLPILLNEVTKITRGSDQLWIAGLDDSNFYSTHDLGRVMRALPPGACTILLSHSPEIALELPEDRFDLVLCGHTHGGQLCLPGGRWLHVPVRGIKREFICGPWRVNDTQLHVARHRRVRRTGAFWRITLNTRASWIAWLANQEALQAVQTIRKTATIVLVHAFRRGRPGSPGSGGASPSYGVTLGLCFLA